MWYLIYIYHIWYNNIYNICVYIYIRDKVIRLGIQALYRIYWFCTHVTHFATLSEVVGLSGVLCTLSVDLAANVHEASTARDGKEKHQSLPEFLLFLLFTCKNAGVLSKSEVREKVDMIYDFDIRIQADLHVFFAQVDVLRKCGEV